MVAGAAQPEQRVAQALLGLDVAVGHQIPDRATGDCDPPIGGDTAR
jgi:hypothetical protein